MSENTENTSSDRPTFKMTDDLIAMIRELVQLSLLTGTNIIDHMRALVTEITPDGRVTVTPEYIQAYNTMVSQLASQAEARANVQATGQDANTDA
jgi:hypothetical protein